MTEDQDSMLNGYVPDRRELTDHHDASPAPDQSITRKDFLTIVACSTVLTASAIVGLAMVGAL